MPDIATISAFLGSIKTAKEHLTLIYDAPKTLEKTELEYKIASLTKILTELENQARDFEEIIQGKNNKIIELENLLAFKPELIRHKDKYYESDENNNPKGDPYCSLCWESEMKAIHLINTQNGCFECPKCKSKYGRVTYQQPNYYSQC